MPELSLKYLLVYGLLWLVCAGSGCEELVQETISQSQKAYKEQVGSGKLTDDMVRRYIRTYRILKKQGHNYLAFSQRYADDVQRQQQAFKMIEGDIRRGGFADYTEFVKTNAKIAWAWNMYQARRGMEKQQQLQGWAHKELDGGMAEIRKALADPQVPESTKRELRATLRQLTHNKRELSRTYQKNKKWADVAMDMSAPLTNEHDMQLIRRHEKELMQVFSGLSAAQLQQIQRAAEQMGR